MTPARWTLGLIFVGLAGWFFVYSPRQDDQATGPATAILIPASLTEPQITGARVFEARCSLCHGANAGGSDTGPPLIHKIYEPSHHGDGAFFLAAQRGVRAHHWKFGDMPPVTDVTRADITSVIDYIRAVQRENGIN